mmetsp:Transcript_1753/g.4424  ORF Transcript_1753/g.4424 Transcript_1753/m.4424 type:complete len:334 (+) Transcript_1753:1945-2946(+)
MLSRTAAAAAPAAAAARRLTRSDGAGGAPDAGAAGDAAAAAARASPAARPPAAASLPAAAAGRAAVASANADPAAVASGSRGAARRQRPAVRVHCGRPPLVPPLLGAAVPGGAAGGGGHRALRRAARRWLRCERRRGAARGDAQLQLKLRHRGLRHVRGPGPLAARRHPVARGAARRQRRQHHYRWWPHGYVAAADGGRCGGGGGGALRPRPARGGRGRVVAAVGDLHRRGDGARGQPQAVARQAAAEVQAAHVRAAAAHAQRALGRPGCAPPARRARGRFTPGVRLTMHVHGLAARIALSVPRWSRAGYGRCSMTMFVHFALAQLLWRHVRF